MVDASLSDLERGFPTVRVTTLATTHLVTVCVITLVTAVSRWWMRRPPRERQRLSAMLDFL
jgi:hypothetical protein